MENNFLSLGLAFLEGFALIISPCILPILPIILSASLTGGKSRPLGIIVGFILTFTCVTLFSHFLIQLAHIDQNLLRNISFSILLLMGVIMLSATLTDQFYKLTQGLANVGSSYSIANNPEGGFRSGLLFGALVGIIWTPCAGPILAAVIVQVVLQQSSLLSFWIVLSFSIGIGIPMLCIALFGRAVLIRFSFFKHNTILIRRLLGFIIILTVIYLAFFSTMSTSTYSSSENKSRATQLRNGLILPYPAPEIAGITAWINSPPLQWSQLKNKVVLVDFWTYSCINCIRTLPYLKEWYANYHDKGFEIIGIHSPEFQFEHDFDNVKLAVEKDQIHYPVALDNQFVTWRNFNNQYWPAHYLINKQGQVVYVHFGEGAYEITENNIRFLLNVDEPMQVKKLAQGHPIFERQTPETYLGYGRAQRFASPESIKKDLASSYNYPNNLRLNQWALKGSWQISAEKIVSTSYDASIKLHFVARKVYAVMGSTDASPISVKVFLDGKRQHELRVLNNQLYSLIDLSKNSNNIVEMVADKPGLEMYTFTFGN